MDSISKENEKRIIKIVLDTSSKEWQKVAEQAKDQLTQLQKAIQNSLLSTIDTQKKALELLLVEQNKSVSYLIKKASEHLQNFKVNVLDPIQGAMNELPPRTREALLLLGSKGWYLDMHMPIPALWKLERAFSEGNAEDAEKALADYFEQRVGRIEEFITEKFPHRKHLIHSAFNAHRRGEYELSIPVLLAQTDGICKETVNQYLFIKEKRKKKPLTSIYVEQIVADTYLAALLSPLAETLPINASERERSMSTDTLNRHSVLHGESLKYGNKINSLKAISLINYVAQALLFENKKQNSITKGQK